MTRLSVRRALLLEHVQHAPRLPVVEPGSPHRTDRLSSISGVSREQPVGQLTPVGEAQVLGVRGKLAAAMCSSTLGDDRLQRVGQRGELLAELLEQAEPLPHKVWPGLGEIVLFVGVSGRVEEQLGWKILVGVVVRNEQQVATEADAALASPCTLARDDVVTIDRAAVAERAGERPPVPVGGDLGPDELDRARRPVERPVQALV